jgi:hypothetical protein
VTRCLDDLSDTHYSNMEDGQLLTSARMLPLVNSTGMISSRDDRFPCHRPDLPRIIFDNSAASNKGSEADDVDVNSTTYRQLRVTSQSSSFCPCSTSMVTEDAVTVRWRMHGNKSQNMNEIPYMYISMWRLRA